MGGVRERERPSQYRRVVLRGRPEHTHTCVPSAGHTAESRDEDIASTNTAGPGGVVAREQARALDRETGQREHEMTNRGPFCWTETQVCADTCIFVLLRESP